MMDTTRQLGERWEFKNADNHFIMEASDNGHGRVVYLYPDHTGWRKLGDEIGTPTWNAHDSSFQKSYWKYLTGQQAPKAGTA